jgi:hypothetical protein
MQTDNSCNRLTQTYELLHKQYSSVLLEIHIELTLQLQLELEAVVNYK